MVDRGIDGRWARRRRSALVIGVTLIAFSSVVLAWNLPLGAPSSSVRIDRAWSVTRNGVAGSPVIVPSVRVIARGCDQTLYGSGVIIGGGRVLTARHVVDQASRVVVETEDGHTYVAKSALVDRDGRDAAVVSLGTTVPGGGALQFAEPDRGAAVAVTGHPDGGLLHVDYTTVLTYTAQPPLAAAGTRVMILDNGFEEGMSGGPVSDESGVVVGIAIGVERNTNTGIVTPVSQLGALLQGSGNPLPSARC